jgi:hypothetical protein
LTIIKAYKGGCRFFNAENGRAVIAGEVFGLLYIFAFSRKPEGLMSKWRSALCCVWLEAGIGDLQVGVLNKLLIKGYTAIISKYLAIVIYCCFSGNFLHFFQINNRKNRGMFRVWGVFYAEG